MGLAHVKVLCGCGYESRLVSFMLIWIVLDRKDANTARPLEGLKIIDVGCGGGLVCEVFILLERTRLCCFSVQCGILT